jgi:uncharacterized protein
MPAEASAWKPGGRDVDEARALGSASAKGRDVVAKKRRRPTTSEWVTRASSTIHGRGLYAAKAIPAGTRVIEYFGERITKVEAERREYQRLQREKRGGDGSVYIFVLNKRYDLDGRAAWNTARLINHSCKPNCRSETARGRIWILASRDIAAGAAARLAASASSSPKTNAGA